MNFFAKNLILCFFCIVGLFFFPVQGNELRQNAIHSAGDLDFKIGQMLLIGFRGGNIEEIPTITSYVENGDIGGVILYEIDLPTGDERNIQSPDQLKKLCNSLQGYAKTPLFIGIDQEGGWISRLNESKGFTSIPSAQKLGELNQLESSKDYAKMCAETLAEMNINVNFAPVVDININKDNPVIAKKERSYSSDPEIVYEQARIFVEEHHKRKILTALKHFPGHGSSSSDSHEGFVDISSSWQQEELEPYKNFISHGYCDFIITAHVFHKNLDSDYPATLSHKIIQELLKNELGFQGVVLSDDLQMGAIRQHYDLKETIEKTINAGVDILLFANQQIYDEKIPLKARAIIKELIAEGRISQEQIENSFRKIMHLKTELTLKNSLL